MSEPRRRRLVLVRHGQTEANVEHRLDTALPGARLTAHGLSQAELFGDALAKAQRASAIFASEALRARQTGMAAQDRSGLVMQIREGLHEVQAGDLEGNNDEASHLLFLATYQAWHRGDLGARVPGGESGRDVLHRYVPVIDELRTELLDDPRGSGDLVVVSHGAAIRLVAAQLAQVPGEFALTHHLDNTETVELEPLPDGGWRAVQWGSLALDAYPDQDAAGNLKPIVDEAQMPIVDDPMG